MSSVLSRLSFLASALVLAACASAAGQEPTPPPQPTPSRTVPTTAPTPPATPMTIEQPTPTPDVSDPMRNRLFILSQPRAVPPLPSLSRVGVSQDNSLALTLNAAIRRALESNNEIEVARDDVRFAETVLESFRGVYDPIFSVTPQINYSVTPGTNTLSGASSLQRTIFTVSPAVSKRFSQGGGQYDVFFNNSRSSTNNQFSQLNPSYQSDFGIQFTQPLLRDRSIDAFRRNIRIQRVRLQQSDAEFRRRVIDVIASVQRAYWDLVFALRDQQNRIANLNLARENFRLTEARVAAGVGAPIERAEIQTELSTRESELLLASQSVSLAENSLKQLLLRDPLAPEWSSQLVPTDEPAFDETPINLQDALTEARTNRPELRRLRLEQDVNNIDLQFYRNQTRPRIDIVSTVSTSGIAGSTVTAPATFTGGTGGTGTNQLLLISGDPNLNSSAFLLDQLNQLRLLQGLQPAVVPTLTAQPTATTPDNLVGGYGRALRNIFTFDARNINVGVTIQFPFRNRTARAQLAGARIQSEQLTAQSRVQEQQVEVEVRNSAQNVETARRRVLTARVARESAELQLEGERRLYQVGRSTQFLLFQRENQLANSRNLELRAQTDYNKALADLQRATSTTLQANNITVETLVEP
ncbi:MAG: TolC family protein [Pyrinomonadaceae bacterium]|nr:TolC family protein [Pyrinomonadaceae bacterium]